MPLTAAVRNIVAAAALLMLLLSCQAGQAAVPVAVDDPDNVDRPSQLPPGMEATKRLPVLSECPKLQGSLRTVALATPASSPPYPPSLDVENGKVWIGVVTTANDAYLHERYGMDVLFRLNNGRRASGRAPISQLCPIANDPATTEIEAPEPTRVYQPPSKP